MNSHISVKSSLRKFRDKIFRCVKIFYSMWYILKKKVKESQEVSCNNLSLRLNQYKKVFECDMWAHKFTFYALFIRFNTNLGFKLFFSCFMKIEESSISCTIHQNGICAIFVFIQCLKRTLTSIAASYASCIKFCRY